MSRGQCLCGAIRYRVNGPLRPVIACHCIQCRRQTGHYWAATAAKTSDLQITGDSLRWFRSSPDAQRGFCSQCGTLLFWRKDGTESTSIGAGSVDMPTGLQTQKHIYCADKGDYYLLPEDGTPHI